MGYTHDNYLSEAPYAELYSFRGDAFAHEAKLEKMEAEAKEAGFKNFRRMYKQYEISRKGSGAVPSSNVTAFTDQPLELDCGPWQCDDLGVSTWGSAAESVVCPHPIMPVCRLVNVDTGTEKMELAFRKGASWRRLIVEKGVLASARSIVALANNGVAVTSETAPLLVKYLHDMENYNYDILPEKPSVGRLGYIDGAGFSPYVDGLIFDGDVNFRNIFRSVRSQGSRKKWLEAAGEARAGSITAKIVVAAAFASVLVGPTGALPFFVHLWGAASGIGKTVALMAAASVWGDPAIGRYPQTFNSTVVGHEKFAAFLNSLPLIIDEMQLARDHQGRSKFNVYQLAEGVGRTRGNRTGGVDSTPTWANCIITSGETPLTQENAGAGAKNRVIEIECNTDKVIQDGPGISALLKQNFGFGGREFVQRLEGQTERVLALYRKTFSALSASDATEKQAMAASLLVSADILADEWIFHSGKPLTAEEIGGFLQSNAAVDVNERAYAYLCDWVSQNVAKFNGQGVEVFGAIKEDSVYIIRSVFCRALEEEGYSPQALLSWMKGKRLIQTRGRANTMGKRINGVLTECVVMSLPGEKEEIPF